MAMQLSHYELQQLYSRQRKLQTVGQGRGTESEEYFLSAKHEINTQSDDYKGKKLQMKKHCQVHLITVIIPPH